MHKLSERNMYRENLLLCKILQDFCKLRKSCKILVIEQFLARILQECHSMQNLGRIEFFCKNLARSCKKYFFCQLGKFTCKCSLSGESVKLGKKLESTEDTLENFRYLEYLFSYFRQEFKKWLFGKMEGEIFLTFASVVTQIASKNQCKLEEFIINFCSWRFS